MEDTTEILAKFRNGEQRYSEDPIFKEAIDSLGAGLGVYAVLDAILRRYEATRARVQKLEDDNASYKDALLHYQK
jgi:hypothetical protein